MIAQLRMFPALALLVLGTCTMMLVPMTAALVQGEYLIARSFFYHAAFFAVLAIMVGLARARPRKRSRDSKGLATLLLAYILLPAVMGAPLIAMLPALTPMQGYFEMLSALTTTGATVLGDPLAIADPIHLWRGMVGWLGGYMILVAAVSILEPLQLGGFEIEAAISPGQTMRRSALGGASAVRERLAHHARVILPVYAGLTAILALVLMIAGEQTNTAVIHAMSVLSTSGITPLAGFADAQAGYIGEVMVFVFLFAVLSRRSITVFTTRGAWVSRRFDPEYKIALACILAVTGLLFVRHFLGAYEVDDQDNSAAAFRALWGSLFNVLSFLSTTGFSSQDWAAARDWSGLGTPGIILMLLCFMGGGIATTTGGVKLLRIYSLFKHGEREVRRLIHPNSVGGSGITARRIRREGAQIAWVFLMLFLLGLSAVLLALTALGQSFENALALAVATLTNTGPAARLLDPGLRFANLDSATQAVLCVAMIFGRVEALVFISLLNPAAWRNGA